MKSHERFFQQEIQRVARAKEQAIDDAYEAKQRKVIEEFFEEIRSGRALLLPDAFEAESWSRTPSIGSCFSYADGSRIDSFLDVLVEERKAKLKQLRDEVKRINRSIMLGDMEKPTLLCMLTEFEAFGDAGGRERNETGNNKECVK